MNRTFQITIAAADGTSAVAKKIAAQLDKLPLALDKTTKAAGRLSGGSYLSALEKSFAGVARRAADMAVSTAKLVPAIGVLSGLTSVAGVAALATNFGRTATQLRNTASSLGMSTDELQRWQNAAQFAGLRTEDMTSALSGIGSAFEASTKGNNQLKADMARFGIVATRTAGGTIDVADGLRQVEQAARGITNMQARREFLDMFGAGALLPMIGRLDELAKKAREAGVSIANTAGGAAFEQEMVRMRIATERFVYQIGEALLPTTTKVVTAITRLTDKFGGLTATRIAEYAERLATAIADIDWDGAAQRASGYIDKLDNVATVTGRVLDLIPGTKREPTPQWNTKYGPGFGDLTWNQKAALAMGGRIDQASQLKLWEKREGLPAGAMDALYAAESDRGRNAGKSSAGALGPFQFMPDTGREYGLNSIEDFMDFQKSGDAAARYLGMLHRKYGSIDKAFAAYNWGPRNVDRQGTDNLPEETRRYLARTRREMGTGQQTVSGQITPAQPSKVELSIKVDAPAGVKVATKASGDVVPNVRVGRSTMAEGPF